MARDRANINTNIWADTHWRQLTRDQQWLYFLILTHSELSYAGVADWRPGRLMQFAAGTSRQEIERIGAEMQAERFIFIDEDSEEVLIRSFLRHDGILKQPKLTISMVNAYAAVSSNNIREVIVHELNRLHSEQPETRAFENTKVLALLKQPARPMDAFTQGFTPELTLGFTLGSTPSATQPQALPTTTATSTTTKEEEASKIADAIVRPDVDSLLDLMDECLAKNGVKVPNRIKRNHDAARLLIDRDGHTVEQVSWMIRWATSHEFWRSNILSLSKLREKFGTLMMQAGVGGQAAAVGFGGEIDVDAVLGKDHWVPGSPPEGLDIAEEIQWKKDQRAAHQAERLAEAKAKLA